ncbi:MAG: 50S ribosomal protein L29 [Candidatus Palauibacterales bacterium]|nr:50S ribosomal protein L29 [Candidatus Palauibacterales bacterium]
MKPDEIRELTDRELQEQIDEREEELFRLKFRGAYQELENPALVKELRRDVARMKTIQRERELAEAEEADE